MRSVQYAFLLMEDKELSDVEILNLSGILEEIPREDVASILHAISVLKNADERFLKRSAKEFFNE